ncbi:MAG: HAMP domain-containing sensor histidine kinase [bacterium]|nr:HAMP domain-containing sensor histidine kinase [bacterium]
MLKIKRPRQWLRMLRRVDFTLRSAIAAIILLVFFSLAIGDFVITASQKEHLIQESVLRGELGQFLLNTRELNGSSLLENPIDFTKASRPAQIVTVSRPFFTYFLTKRNTRTFSTDNLRFDPPHACVLEFLSNTTPSRVDASSFPLQTCFAAIPSDPTGRYVYFALRYPTPSIHRHTQGEPIENSDRLVIHFFGKREVIITLTFQQAPQFKGSDRHLAASDHFDSLHEIASYLPEDGGRATRLLNAQAFEQRVSDTGENIVSILGRIDSTLLPVEDQLDIWPSPATKDLKIGIEVIPAANSSMHSVQPLYKFGPEDEGTAQLSLEQAYRVAVPSKATLVVSAGGGNEKGKILWTSNSLIPSEPQRHQGWFQIIANNVARLMVSGVQKVSVTQDHRLSGLPLLATTLTEDANIVPDIAARSLAWQFAAIFAVAALIWFLWGGSRRLERLTRTAHIAAVTRGGSFVEYANSSDQIGTLGRVLHLLFKRDQQRMAFQRKRLERENQQKAEVILKEKELLETRREILNAIGHEIRSPLANLLASSKQDSTVNRNLSRMERAVNALQEAATIEEGLMNGVIAARVDDLGKFISKLAENLAANGKPIIGYGERSGVLAYFDDIMLETILDHLLDNAERHATPGSIIEVRWTDDNDLVTIEIFNKGKTLEDCENIFKLGVSDPENGGHLGLGLYAARMYLFGMHGSISAANRDDGVAFIIHLQKSG